MCHTTSDPKPLAEAFENIEVVRTVKVHKAMAIRTDPLVGPPDHLLITMTFDNGREFQVAIDQAVFNDWRAKPA